MLSKKEILMNSRPIKKEFYCIYALIKDKKIVYIGQSSSIIGRLNSHLNSRKDFDSWSIIESFDFLTKKEFDDIEKKYIFKYKPIYNIQRTGKKRSYKKKESD